MAADGSRWQFLGRAPSRLAPRDAIDNEFFEMADEAKFALHYLVVNHGVVSSWSADSRRTGSTEGIGRKLLPDFNIDRVYARNPRSHAPAWECRSCRSAARLGGVDRDVTRTYSKIGLLDRLSQHCINDDSRARPGTGDLLRYGAGVPGTWNLLRCALQHIQLALPRFVKLSNWVVCEFDVSLGPDGGRKIFSKMSSGDELRAGSAPTCQSATSPAGWLSTRARATPWHSQHRKTRKLDTTDRPLVAAELERQPATISV